MKEKVSFDPDQQTQVSILTIFSMFFHLQNTYYGMGLHDTPVIVAAVAIFVVVAIRFWGESMLASVVTLFLLLPNWCSKHCDLWWLWLLRFEFKLCLIWEIYCGHCFLLIFSIVAILLSITSKNYCEGQIFLHCFLPKTWWYISLEYLHLEFFVYVIKFTMSSGWIEVNIKCVYGFCLLFGVFEGT